MFFKKISFSFTKGTKKFDIFCTYFLQPQNLLPDTMGAIIGKCLKFPTDQKREVVPRKIGSPNRMMKMKMLAEIRKKKRKNKEGN